MVPQRPEDGFVRMPEHEFEAILARAAEEGAKRALADVGLEGDEAALDIRDLRSMMEPLRLVRRRAAILRALYAGVDIRLKVFVNGPQPKLSDLFVTQYAPARRVFLFLEGPMITYFFDHWREAPEGAWRGRRRAGRGPSLPRSPSYRIAVTPRRSRLRRGLRRARQVSSRCGPRSGQGAATG